MLELHAVAVVLAVAVGLGFASDSYAMEASVPHCGLMLTLPDDMAMRGKDGSQSWIRRGEALAAVSVVCEFEGVGSRMNEFQTRTETALKRRGYLPTSSSERVIAGATCVARVLSRDNQPSKSHAVALYVGLPPGEGELPVLVLVEARTAAEANQLAQSVCVGARFQSSRYSPMRKPSNVARAVVVVAADGRLRAGLFDAAGRPVVWRGVPVLVVMTQPGHGGGQAGQKLSRTVCDSRDVSMIGAGLWVVGAATRLEFRAGEATLQSATVTMPP